MARKANPSLIGAFVLGAMVLAVAGLVVFGGGKFLRQTQKAVLYFDGSTKGLNIGSPVTFRGVKIGQVTDVRVVVDPQALSIRTPVLIEIDSKRITDTAGRRIQFEKGAAGLKRLVEDRGMRAELKIQSFVTGQLAVDFDFYPNTPVRLTGLTLLAKEYPELPTIPSSLDKLAQTIESLPIGELVQGLQGAVAGLERLVNAPEIREILRDATKLVKNADQKVTTLSAGLEDTLRDARKLVQNVDGTVGPLTATVQEAVAKTETNLSAALADVRKLAENLDGRVGPLADDLEKALQEAKDTFTQVQAVLAAAEGLVEPGSAVHYNLNTTLEAVTRAAQSFRQLTTYLAQHPNAVLFGRPPAGGNTR